MDRLPDLVTRVAGGRRGKPRRAAGLLLVTVLLLLGALGAGMVTAGLTVGDVAPPQPASRAETPEAGGDIEWTPNPVGTGLPRSAPTRITIPRIGVEAQIMALGLRKDGSVDVPPLKQAEKAGWYKLGASPGEIGNAVVVGHVDSAETGPAVFYELGALKPGDLIELARQDGTEVRFRVDQVKAYAKTAFPTELVYAPRNTAGLRLVTCGGTFDRKTRSYRDNVVVFATRTV